MARRCPRTRSEGRAPRPPREFRPRDSTGSFSKMPAATRTISPHASVRRLFLVREAPTPEHATALTARLRRRPPARSRDFPMPGGPSTVTRWARPPYDRSVPGPADDQKLPVPTDERASPRSDGCAGATSGSPTSQRQGLALALRLDRGRALEGERVPGQPVGLLADDRAAGRRRRLESRRRVHDVAGREGVPGAALSATIASPLPTATRTWRSSPAWRSFSSRTPSRTRERRPNGSLGVVAARERRAEHRHHRVADVLLHDAAVALDPRRVSW